MGREDYILLRYLVRRGDGKRSEILRQALTIGLRALKKAGEREYTETLAYTVGPDTDFIEGGEAEPAALPQRPLHPLAASVTGGQFLRPSVQRRLEAGEEIDLEDE